MTKTFMAIDQNGFCFPDLGKHPRKELMERLGSKHCSKMFVDTKDGKTYHCGYVIGRLWLTLFEVSSFRKEVS